jgi:hypothetical protein
MIGPVISIPNKRPTPWHAETDADDARAWLESLPLADSAESARELYQTLYTLNRQELSPQSRLALMELYRGPIKTVTGPLEFHVTRLPLPLASNKRRLAEFIRILQLEMANGYKCCLVDLVRSSVLWGKKSLLTTCTERALWYLGEVLLKSYLVYMPYPAGVWREIHELYRYAEQNKFTQEPVDISIGSTQKKNRTIIENYLRILLLGVTNPYQLPQNECVYVNHMLIDWAKRARLERIIKTDEEASRFNVDLSKDAPPVPVLRDGQSMSGGEPRSLDAKALVEMAESYLKRVKDGESVQSLGLKLDILDTACVDMLQHVVRSWGIPARRRHNRIRRHSRVFVCVGINAVHFFSNNQKPFFIPPELETGRRPDDAARLAKQNESIEDVPADLRGIVDEAYIDLGDPFALASDLSHPTVGDRDSIPSRVTDYYRVDHWQVRDLGPQGMSLVREGESGANNIRVGDLIGIARVDDVGQWSLGVARWLKNPKPRNLEIGVELLAPVIKPVSIQAAYAKSDERPIITQALLLPPIEVLQRPPSIVVPCGICRPDGDFYLTEGEAPSRVIRSNNLLERTGSFEHMAFSEQSKP